MKLTLYRTQYLPTCTKGNLYVDSNLECFTLEPPLKFNGALNVPLKTCVLEGTFTVEKFPSKHFSRAVPVLLSVPGRDSIEMHPLNLPAQTEGCIGVGKTWVDSPAIENSDVAFDALMEQLERAWQAGETVTIEIESIFEVPHV